MIKKIKRKPILVFTTIFYILFVVSMVCSIYSILRVANIENLLRYLISGLLFLIIVYFSLSFYKIVYKGKNAGIILYDILFVVLFTISSFAFATINGFYNSIDDFYKDSSTYSSSIVVMSDSDYKNIDDIKNIKLGIVDNSTNIEEYIIPNEIIKDKKLDNELIKYNSTTELVKALYEKEVEAAFLPSAYSSRFINIEEYSDIGSKTKIIYTQTKEIKKDDKEDKLDADEPFTVLILGMDSTVSDISKVTSFNADSLMLLTFNPKTYNATILSIPRDTYVPIACINGKPESKITHSGWNGESCVISTIEDWTNINIDYYAKVNFTALVKLVDTLGGIEVEVPYSFCEQNSERLWGDKTIYVEKGLRTINGEQALALSRNRHPNPECGAKWTNYYSDDIVRGENQQLVLNALINKVMQCVELNKLSSIINIIGKNVDTNMQIDEITSYYTLVKKIATESLSTNNNVINFERLHISTYGKSMYDSLLGMSNMSIQIYYKDSYGAIVNAMKMNLGLEKTNMIKTFSFSVNKPYEKKTTGDGTFTQDDIEIVPSFINKDIGMARTWAQNHNIEIIINYKDVSEGLDNVVISQSITPSYPVDKVNTSIPLTITVSKLVVENNYNVLDNFIQ